MGTADWPLRHEQTAFSADVARLVPDSPDSPCVAQCCDRIFKASLSADDLERATSRVHHGATDVIERGASQVPPRAACPAQGTAEKSRPAFFEARSPHAAQPSPARASLRHRKRQTFLAPPMSSVAHGHQANPQKNPTRRIRRVADRSSPPIARDVTRACAAVLSAVTERFLRRTQKNFVRPERTRADVRQPRRDVLSRQQPARSTPRHYLYHNVFHRCARAAYGGFELRDEITQARGPCRGIRENSERVVTLHDATHVRVEGLRKVVFQPFAPAHLRTSLPCDAPQG